MKNRVSLWNSAFLLKLNSPTAGGEMDKEQFLRTAPAYYALGIVFYAINNGEDNLEQRVIEEYYTDTDGEENTFPYFERGRIYDKAVEWLVDQKVVVCISDDFGPTFLRFLDGSLNIIRDLEKDKASPFGKYSQSKNPRGWVHSALRNVEIAYRKLDIKDEDFEDHEKDWIPLPLDRADSLVKKNDRGPRDSYSGCTFQ